MWMLACHKQTGLKPVDAQSCEHASACCLVASMPAQLQCTKTSRLTEMFKQGQFLPTKHCTVTSLKLHPLTLHTH